MHRIPKFTGYQKFVVALLAFLQFTIVLDFMIISPLGAIVMPALRISPAQFGIVVSAYAFSAGISGLLAAGFADRFDRKKILIFFYGGFILATLFCGLVQRYEYLVAARMATGFFGGVMHSIVLAMAADLFAYEMRGRVMGTIQTAFGASQILGIPAGLFLSNHWGWQTPFLMIVAVSLAVFFVVWKYLRPMPAHIARGDRNAFTHIRRTVVNPDYLKAFAMTALLSTGGFMLMPFGSAFTVHNLGIPMEHLPMIYLVTGIATMFIGPLVGRVSDKMGKLPVFLFGGVLSILTVLVYTNLGKSPLFLVILVNVVLFVSIFSRLIPAQALTSAVPTPENRGSFMAVNSSLQQIAGGFASVLAGAIVVEEASGQLAHFDTVGYVIVGTVLTTMVLMVSIDRTVTKRMRESARLPDTGVIAP